MFLSMEDANMLHLGSPLLISYPLVWPPFIRLSIVVPLDTSYLCFVNDLS
jgi:hypothetical protein